jgi:hypothetical protein
MKCDKLAVEPMGVSCKSYWAYGERKGLQIGFLQAREIFGRAELKGTTDIQDPELHFIYRPKWETTYIVV